MFELRFPFSDYRQWKDKTATFFSYCLTGKNSGEQAWRQIIYYSDSMCSNSDNKAFHYLLPN